MSVLLILAAAASGGFAAAAPRDAIAPIVRCGVPRARIGAGAYVAIARGPALGEAQRRCVARAALATDHDVIFTDFEQERAFAATIEAERYPETRRAARAWLAAHGLLDRLPRYDPAKQALQAYEKTLEALCGVKPGEVTNQGSARSLALVPSATTPARDDAFLCLTNALDASNLHDHGIHYGRADVMKPEDLGEDR